MHSGGAGCIKGPNALQLADYQDNSTILCSLVNVYKMAPQLVSHQVDSLQLGNFS